jgi:hypothetical protein
MNEIILNHVKAYYHGVKDIKCLLLRAELGNRINKFKQRLKSQHHQSKIDYLAIDTFDNAGEEDTEILPKVISNENMSSKRKRTNDDDEKENDRQQRKVIIKSTTTVKSEQRTVIVKKSINNFETKIDKFDHEYCDIMYDNEYEGLHLLHYDEVSEDLEDLSLPIEIKPTDNTLLENDYKPSESILASGKILREN